MQVVLSKASLRTMLGPVFLTHVFSLRRSLLGILLCRHVKLGHIRIVGALVANLVLRPDTLKCGPFVRTDAALLLQQSLQVGQARL